MSRKLIFAAIGLAPVIVIGALAVAARPKPTPTPELTASPSPQGQAKITWSQSQISETLFPGTNKIVTVRFRSSQDLGSVALWITPSLDGTVSTNPSSFASIRANRDYEVAVVVSVPAEFKKRSFGGTIHLRNDGKPPRTFAEPLQVEFRIDFLTYKSESIGVTFSYPPAWITTEVATPSPNDPTPTILAVTSPSGSKLLVLPDGGEGYDLGDELEQTVSAITLSGFSGVRRDFKDSNGRAFLSHIELRGIPGHPAFVIELRVRSTADLTSLETLLRTIQVKL